MTAPERIFIAGGWGEYGSYYPEAVEAEGEHGGRAIGYTRADIPAAMVAAEREAMQARLAAAEKMAEALESARETILQLINARGSEAEGSDEEWTRDIDIARAAWEAAQ